MSATVATALAVLAIVAPARGDGPPAPRDSSAPPTQITVFNPSPLAGAIECAHWVVVEASAVCHVEPPRDGEDAGLLIVPGTPAGADMAKVLDAATGGAS